MDKHEDYGREISTVKTVFLYKINVAVAAILIFINFQTIISFFLDGASVPFILGGISLTLGSVAYGMIALNGYMTKIVIYERGLVKKNLFGSISAGDEDIKAVYFKRITLKKMNIEIVPKDGKPLKINTSKYENSMPVVDYLGRFKKEN